MQQVDGSLILVFWLAIAIVLIAVLCLISARRGEH